MTAPKFTPGPWRVGRKPGPIVYDEGGAQIANLVVPMLPDEEHRANARLIAAAPDLYAALEAQVEEPTVVACCLASAHEALGKAVGRG